MWRWQYESCHVITKNDRVIVMKLFQKLNNAKNTEDYISAYTVLCEPNIRNKYNLCVKYFEDLCSISDRWARYFQRNKSVRGSNTNNYVKAQLLVIKGSLLKRQTQFNIKMLC